VILSGKAVIQRKAIQVLKAQTRQHLNRISEFMNASYVIYGIWRVRSKNLDISS
jgi:hypothetical protein